MRRMPPNIRISEHAIRDYCLRIHNDPGYSVAHPVEEEIRQKLKSAEPSRFKKSRFFGGNKRFNLREIVLLQDETLIYAIRRNNVFSILNVPGTDMISDALYPE